MVIKYEQKENAQSGQDPGSLHMDPDCEVGRFRPDKPYELRSRHNTTNFETCLRELLRLLYAFFEGGRKSSAYTIGFITLSGLSFT